MQVFAHKITHRFQLPAPINVLTVVVAVVLGILVRVMNGRP